MPWLVTPMRENLPFLSLVTRGPPLSPWQVSLRPAPPAQIMLEVILGPYLFLHSRLDIVFRLTFIRILDPLPPSLSSPHPEAMACSLLCTLSVCLPGTDLHIVVVGGGGGETNCGDVPAEGDWAAEPQDGEIVVPFPPPAVLWMQGGAAPSDLLLTVRLGDVVLPQYHPAYGKPSILKR